MPVYTQMAGTRIMDAATETPHVEFIDASTQTGESIQTCAVRIIILFTWSDIMSDQPRLRSDMI